MRTVWSDNSPASLQDEAARVCVLNLHLMQQQRGEVHLPTRIGEKLFQVGKMREKNIY